MVFSCSELGTCGMEAVNLKETCSYHSQSFFFPPVSTAMGLLPDIYFAVYLHLYIIQSYAGFRLACRLPLCRYAAWSWLAVSELQLSAATPLWLYHRAASLPSWIEFNCLRSAAVGKAARLSIYWLDAACRLVIPLRHSQSWSIWILESL